jgi:hypothetical protein
MTVICPYCNKPAKLVDSSIVYGGKSYGMIWLCQPCDAYVGVHKNSKDHAPLGRLANAELRWWKREAHAAFDPLWKEGTMSRGDAYRWMQRVLVMSQYEAHIGKFDISECRALIRATEELRQPKTP